MKECPECEGKGYVIRKSKGAMVRGFRFERVTCPKCQGRGMIFDVIQHS